MNLDDIERSERRADYVSFEISDTSLRVELWAGEWGGRGSVIFYCNNDSWSPAELSPDLARKMGTALLAAARVAERAQR
ncbi:MAG: hypothetical protein ACRCZD_12640 [Phycicoccus sp.]